MPIGIVSDSEFDSELSNLTPGNRVPSPDPPASPVVIPEVVPSIPTRGRAEGDTNVPESLRRIIGEEHIVNGRSAALELASEFGISASSVSAYARGANSTTTYNQPKLENVRHLNSTRNRIVKKATRRLRGALDALTQEKLDMTDARDLSAIAKDMAVVIKQMEPQVEPDGESKPQFIVYAPTFRQENTYETIQVSE